MNKVFRNNASAIITALVVAFFIGNYIFRIIPANERVQDEYNKIRLDQFKEQFSFTLKDYVNAIDTNELRNALKPVINKFYKERSVDKECPCEADPVVAGNATRFKKAFYDSSFKRNINLSKRSSLCSEDSLFINLAKQVKSSDDKITLALLHRTKETDSTDLLVKSILLNDPVAFSKLLEQLVIQKIAIQSIQNTASELILSGKIILSFDKGKEGEFSPLIKQLREVAFTKSISKSSLKTRLAGQVLFDHWIIYDVNENLNKIEVLVNDGVDFQERDSLQNTSSKRGVITYSFSDKRFYKTSFNIEGTNHYVMIAAAVNQEKFETQIHAADVSSTIAAIIFVILIFLCIPLIKPLISSAKENLTQRDLLSTTSALSIFTVITGCFIFATFLTYSQKRQTVTELKDENSRIGKVFVDELNKYIIYKKMVKENRYWDSTNVHLKLSYSPTDSLRAVQNFFLMSSTGEIIKDVSNKGVKIRKNFTDRNYFKVLADSSTLYTSILTAVYSKNDNVYKFVYANKDTNSIFGFVYKPFCATVKVDFDFGYILCTKDGQVINHNDSAKNLNENFYRNYQDDPNVQNLFHGFVDTTFSLRYDNENCVFYGRRLNYETSGNPYPLYLLTYKKITFEDNLKVYTLVNGFIFSLCYSFLLILITFFYSSVFYNGNVRVFSRYHFYWLFPDNSRETEYKTLTLINGLLILAFLGLVFCHNSSIFYDSLLAGFDLIFINFVFLSQREFLPVDFFEGIVRRLEKFKPGSKAVKSSAMVLTKDTKLHKKEKRSMTVFVLIAILPVVLSRFIAFMHHPFVGLAAMIFIQLIYLYVLGKNCSKISLKLRTPNPSLDRNIFNIYTSSNVLFHYWVIPCILVFCLYSGEHYKYENFRQSTHASSAGHKEGFDKIQAGHNSLNEILQDLRGGVNPPSWKPLSKLKFDKFSLKQEGYDLSKIISTKYNLYLLLVVLLAFLISVSVFLVLVNVIRFYSSRFFFNDLTDCYLQGKMEKEKNEFLNDMVILPPYNSEDLLGLENNEKPKMERKSPFTGSEIYGEDSDTITNIEKIELINIQNIKTYRLRYLNMWNSLSDDERFALRDFADDFFVNYKNKPYLVTLMQKGYVIADPLTGRLRLMNFTFRVFILKYTAANPGSTVPSEERNGTYSKWKLPLFIIAFSGLLFLLYMNKDRFDEMLLIAGTLISALGVIVKLLETYKKQTV